MKSLPRITPYKATKTQIDHLAKWLEAYELKKNAPPVSIEAAAEAGAADVPIPCREFDPEMEPGQIRLFAPSVMPDLTFLYFAVLKAWDNDEWLIAPFSEFSAPALPGELLLGERDALHLKVLCLWNAHTVHVSVLTKSWIESALPAEEQWDAWAVFKHVATGAKLPESLTDRTGPHIVRPSDPRVAYQHEAAKQLGAVAGRIGVHEQAGNIIAFPAYRRFYEDMPMAADDGLTKSPCITVFDTEDISASVKKSWAVCTQFDTLIPGSDEEIRCEWVVDVDSGIEIKRVILFADKMESPLGYPAFGREEGRLRIVLLNHRLPADGIEPVKSAEGVKILLMAAEVADGQ